MLRGVLKNNTRLLSSINNTDRHRTFSLAQYIINIFGSTQLIELYIEFVNFIQMYTLRTLLLNTDPIERRVNSSTLTWYIQTLEVSQLISGSYTTLLYIIVNKANSLSTIYSHYIPYYFSRRQSRIYNNSRNHIDTSILPFPYCVLVVAEVQNLQEPERTFQYYITFRC